MKTHAQGESGADALQPGQYVRLDGAPEWGVGRIQSVAGTRITVNFEHAGKRLIILGNAALIVVEPTGLAP